jgi:hypothetical protein
MATAAKIAICCALLTMYGYRLAVNVVDLDLYHEMALAREALLRGSVPMDDVFAFTPTRHPVVHHEWGAGMIAYGIAASFGGAGILALKYALALGTALLALAAGPRNGWWRNATWVLAPVAIMLSDYGFSPVRAQAYSFLLAAATMLCLRWDRAGERRWIIAYVPLFVFWVNVHGGFIVGPVLLGAEALERLVLRRPWVHLALVLAGLGVLVAATPFGLAYYGYIFRALTIPRPAVAEWAPLWSSGQPWHHLVMSGASIAIAAYAITESRNEKRVDGIAILVVLGTLSLRHSRMLPFYAIAWLTTVPEYFAGTSIGKAAQNLAEKRARSVAIAATAVAVLFSTLLLRERPWHLAVPNRPGYAGSPMSFPVGAVNYLRAALFRGNVLTPFEQGAYVSWKLYPDVKVSLDSRYEVAYETDLVDTLVRFYRDAADVPGVLARYGADLVLVPVDSPLARKPMTWPRIYQDDGFILYARPDLRLQAASSVARLTDTFP